MAEFEFSAKIGARMHPSEFQGQLQHLLVHRENHDFRLRSAGVPKLGPELGQTVSEFEFSAKIGARMHPSEFRGQLQHLLVHRENRDFG